MVSPGIVKVKPRLAEKAATSDEEIKEGEQVRVVAVDGMR